MAYTPPSHPPSHLHPPLQHPQRLLFNAATLDDANTLSHYGISREATLTLLEIVRPRVTKICGWAGWFLDRVELFMDDGSSAHYGEVGGEAKPAFDLQEGEWITEVEGRNHGQYQGGGVTFTTNLGRQYEAKGSHFLPTFLGVAPLSDSVTFTAPPGQAIVGLVPCSARGGGFKGAVFAAAPSLSSPGEEKKDDDDAAQVWRITTADGPDAAVNFLDADGDIMFHFNPRPKGEGHLVMNNCTGGSWQQEERVAIPDHAFTAVVSVDDKGYAVSFEGSTDVAHVFKHRVPWANFASLSSSPGEDSLYYARILYRGGAITPHQDRISFIWMSDMPLFCVHGLPYPR